MKKRKRGIISAILTALVLGLGLTIHVTYRIEPLAEEWVVELGEEISDDPADYVRGTEWAVSGTELDFSDVDCDRVGTYELLIHHGWQDFTCEVVVRDTTPPSLRLEKGDVYLEKDVAYGAERFVKRSRDRSGAVTLSVSLDGEDFAPEVSGGTCGSHTLTVRAEDRYGNVREASRTVTVDTAPTFGELPEYYVALGSDADFLEHVTAHDEVDGDVTAGIEADLSGLDVEAEGCGTVVYSVTDSYGLTASAEVQVQVCSAEKLQQMINSHQINRLEQQIVGAYNLYDGGVYEEEDVKSVLEELEPAFVCLKKEVTGGYYKGSGFLLEMTENVVIICTNRHVVHNFDSMDVYFHDGTKAEGIVLGRTGWNAGEDDIAFVSVERSALPDRLTDTLKTVHVNMGYWDGLEDAPQVEVGMRCLDERGNIWIERDGVILQKEAKPERFERYGTFTEVSLELVHGMSGSALVDGYGNLVGMAVCITTIDGVEHYWCVKLDFIAKAYREITGRSMYYE